jgi:hypothetical protein|tara:strand:- start:172 stop:1398 length:1227 start_codon:yes stop_codon:yes gene_type:complete
MSTEIRDIINLLEDEEEPITKPQVEKVLKNDGYEHLKVSGNKITVLTQLPDGSKSGEFRKATIDEILQTLSREVPEHEPSFSSATNLSSIGGILFKNSKVHIVVKDIGKQGDKSAGIANEVEIAGMIESVIQKYGSADITFTDDRGVELEIKNADNVIVAGRDTGNRKKADILITSEDQSLPISIKKVDAAAWESADSMFGAKAKTIIDKLIKDGKLELIELKDKTTAKGEPVYKLSKEIVIEPTAEEAMNAIFGSDINPAGGVIIQTFKPEHYTQDEDKIDVEAHIVIKEIDDIPQSHLMVWLLRNDSTRNIASIGYAGIRPLGVTLERGFGKSGNKDVITVNKDGNVVSAKDIIALDKEIDRIQQVDIDKRELRDKAKDIADGGGQTVDDIFAKKMDKEGVGRRKR